MEFLKPVINSEPSDLFSEAFGVSQERSDELNAKIEKALDDDENNSESAGFTNGGLVAMFVSFAETPEEVAFLACQAGKLISHARSPIERLIESLSTKKD